MSTPTAALLALGNARRLIRKVLPVCPACDGPMDDHSAAQLDECCTALAPLTAREIARRIAEKRRAA